MNWKTSLNVIHQQVKSVHLKETGVLIIDLQSLSYQPRSRLQCTRMFVNITLFRQLNSCRPNLGDFYDGLYNKTDCVYYDNSFSISAIFKAYRL